MEEAQLNMHTNSSMEDKIEAYRQAISDTPIGEQPFSIYRVPSHIRHKNQSYYEPRMVSIGPYHQGKEHLRAMEEHKWRYLGEFINRGRGLKEDYIEQIRGMTDNIRACYFESFDMQEDLFVQTMLLDSCFIIQLFTKWSFREPDPVRDVGWALPLLVADLIMLDNQIPLYVLTRMYNIHLHGDLNPPNNNVGRRPPLIQLMAESLHRMHNRYTGRSPNLPDASVDIKHLLHLYYYLFVPAPGIITRTMINRPRVPRNDQENNRMNEPLNARSVMLEVCNPGRVCGSLEIGIKEGRSPRMIPSATELKDFGVTFKKKKKNFNSILDISFKNGVLEMPYIVLEEDSRSRYLNLIAFEQCSSTSQKHLTSYAVLMDCLINTSKDATVLQRCGIIENKLANSKEAAKFFNQLRDCAYIDFEDHYLKQVFVDVTSYCEDFWPKHKAKLRHEYFSSPWTFISLCAALIVVGITIARFVLMFFHKSK